jgi:hypothetical protein
MGISNSKLPPFSLPKKGAKKMWSNVSIGYMRPTFMLGLLAVLLVVAPSRCLGMREIRTLSPKEAAGKALAFGSVVVPSRRCV